MKKYIKLGLLIIWLGVIYYFSSQDGTTSGNLSSGLLKEIANLFSIGDINGFVDKYGTLFRKLAHFTEYFILAVLVYISLKEYTDKNIIAVVVILCTIYAISDEIHQLFVSDRAFAIIDILIDSFGSLIGSVLLHLISTLCFQEKKQ